MIQRKNKEGEKPHRRVNVFQKWNTNLPAGLFFVVSSLNEYIYTYICFIIVTHGLGKGGIMGSMSPHPWFLLLKIKYEDNTVNAEIFCVNFFSLIFFWQNL